jgi:ryanodine receptor 2
MMVLVVVYLYTVVAFNFFRKFYVQGKFEFKDLKSGNLLVLFADGEEGEEPDRKCHNMAACFIYMFYQGK